VCAALSAAWSAIRNWNISWTFYCQGALPDATLLGNGPVPGMVLWTTVRAANIITTPVDRDIDALMTVKELGEAEWAQLLEEWEAW
jgi:hypothetical protein